MYLLLSSALKTCCFKMPTFLNTNAHESCLSHLKNCRSCSEKVLGTKHKQQAHIESYNQTLDQTSIFSAILFTVFGIFILVAIMTCGKKSR